MQTCRGLAATGGIRNLGAGGAFDSGSWASRTRCYMVRTWFVHGPVDTTRSPAAYSDPYLVHTLYSFTLLNPVRPSLILYFLPKLPWRAPGLGTVPHPF